MPRRRFSWDRFADYHLILAFALCLVLADVAALIFLLRPTGLPETAPGLKALFYGLAAGATGLTGWALLLRYFEKKRRTSLDRVVDSELAGKWDPGFSKLLGTYDKPWYILCGETAVGKTAALRAANLPLAIGPDGHHVTDANQGKNGTFMFDWWFFEDAVVFDSAGDLIENPDGRWLFFLQNVRQARPVQPINGMILAVSALDLTSDSVTLRRKAELLARQVEIARAELRVRFPLYLLVTKSDLITGFSDYFPVLADLKSSFQIVGWSNPQDPRTNDAATTQTEIRDGLKKLSEDLRNRRSARLRRTFSAREDAQDRLDHLDEMFAFPAAISSMAGSLEDFVARLLECVGDEAPPFMRGIYFTSALQTGQALDFELKKVLGIEWLPQSRRGASDRAYFIRDLFLEKIIPEAGMVTPLEDVVSATRRRGRALIAGASVAAAVVLVGTMVGYLQTVGKINPHRELWNQLATAADHGNLSQLALFDANGKYRGSEHVSSGSASSSETVLQFHRDGVNLMNQNPSSWLLPISADLNGIRRHVQGDVFTDLVLAPAIDAGLGTKSSGDPPPHQVDLYCSILGALNSKSTTYANLLTLVSQPGSILMTTPEVGELLDAWKKSSGSPADQPVPPNIRAQLSVAAQKALIGWIDAKTAAIEQTVNTKENFLTKVNELAKIEDEQILQTANSTLPPFDNTINGDIKFITDSWSTSASSANLVSLNSAAGLAIAPANETSEIKKLLAIPDASVNFPDVKKAMDSLDTNVNTQFSGLAAAIGAVSSEHDEIVASLEEFARLHLGKDTQKPLIIQRFETYQRLRGTVADWSKPFSPPHGEAGYIHPFFSIPASLKAIEAEFDSASLITRPMSGDLAVTLLGTRFNAVCVKVLQAGRSGRKLAVIKVCLATPERVWTTEANQVNGMKPADFKITIERLENGSYKLNVPPCAQPDLLKDWTQAWTSEKQMLDPAFTSTDADVKKQLQQIDNCFIAYNNNYVQAWLDAVVDLESPKLTSWSDFKQIADTAGQGRMQAGLAENFTVALNAISVAAEPDVDPEIAANVEKAKAEIIAGSSAPLRKSVGKFLRSWHDEAESTRIELLKMSDLDNAPASPVAASAVDKFWTTIFTEYTKALIQAATPEVLNQMTTVHKMSADKFPLCSEGSSEWEDPNVTKLVEIIKAIYPQEGERLQRDYARQIRDLQWGSQPLIDEDWKTYFAWISGLNDFLKPQQPHQQWEIWFDKSVDENERRQGTWQAVMLKQVGIDQNLRGGLAEKGKPVKIKISAGADLFNQLDIRLTSSNESEDAISPIVGIDFSKHWAMLRLHLRDQPAHTHTIAITDGNTDAKLIVDISTNGSPLPTQKIPAVIPEVPKDPRSP